MGRIIKSWWFWGLAALGIAGIVAVSLNRTPDESHRAVLDGDQTKAEGVVRGSVEDDSVHAADSPVVALETPAGSVDIASLDQVAANEVESGEDQISGPEGYAAEEAPEILPDTTLSAETHAESAVVSSAPEVAFTLTEDFSANNVPENQTTGDAAFPSPEVEVATPHPVTAPQTPDPVEPALAPSGPRLGAVSASVESAANAPLAERPSLLGESSPPLSLAQVLPPGEAPTPDQIAPRFDLVRVAPDGSALIAGRAAPGANVQVFSGNIPVAEATATARGEFVVFLDSPKATTLDMQIPEAPEGAALVVSQEDIVILPTAPDAADATPIVVRRTPDAVQIVQPAAPAVPLNVSLDLVSYTDSGAVQLAGRGQPGNVARVYADGTLAGEAPIAEGGTWELEVSDIAEGRYVLRVDEITPAGEVFSRTESPFQRQFPEAQMPNSFSQGAKIIVQPGNTLWLMATEAYGDGDAFSQIYTANKDAIRDPDLIYPGQIFSIPRIEE